MDEIDFDAEFAKLTQGIDEVPEAISLADISTFVEVLNETSMHVCRFLTILLCIGPEDPPIRIPQQLLNIIPALALGAEELTKILHAYTCTDEDEEEDDEDEDDPVD